MHLDIDGTGGAFMTSLQQLKRFEARISLFKSLDCPLALAAAGRNQRFTRYPPMINHNQGWCNSQQSWLLLTVLGWCYDTLYKYTVAIYNFFLVCFFTAWKSKLTHQSHLIVLIPNRKKWKKFLLKMKELIGKTSCQCFLPHSCRVGRGIKKH